MINGRVANAAETLTLKQMCLNKFNHFAKGNAMPVTHIYMCTSYQFICMAHENTKFHVNDTKEITWDESRITNSTNAHRTGTQKWKPKIFWQNKTLHFPYSLVGRVHIQRNWWSSYELEIEKYANLLNPPQQKKTFRRLIALWYVQAVPLTWQHLP